MFLAVQIFISKSKTRLCTRLSKIQTNNSTNNSDKPNISQYKFSAVEILNSLSKKDFIQEC